GHNGSFPDPLRLGRPPLSFLVNSAGCESWDDPVDFDLDLARGDSPGTDSHGGLDAVAGVRRGQPGDSAAICWGRPARPRAGGVSLERSAASVSAESRE